MTEEKPQEKPQEEKKDEEMPFLSSAENIAKRIEEGNAKYAALLHKQEELMAKQTLGGRSEAGDHPEKKEDTPKEYKDKVMSGSLNG